MKTSETQEIEFLVGELTAKLTGLLHHAKQPRDVVMWSRRWIHRFEQFNAQLRVFHARDYTPEDDVH